MTLRQNKEPLHLWELHESTVVPFCTRTNIPFKVYVDEKGKVGGMEAMNDASMVTPPEHRVIQKEQRPAVEELLTMMNQCMLCPRSVPHGLVKNWCQVLHHLKTIPVK